MASFCVADHQPTISPSICDGGKTSSDLSFFTLSFFSRSLCRLFYRYFVISFTLNISTPNSPISSSNCNEHKFNERVRIARLPCCNLLGFSSLLFLFNRTALLNACDFKRVKKRIIIFVQTATKNRMYYVGFKNNYSSDFVQYNTHTHEDEKHENRD